MVQLEAKKEKGQVVISENSFEHLLSCLDNQKFVGDLNADALSMGKNAYDKVQNETQEAIDDFNRQCRRLLHDKRG